MQGYEFVTVDVFTDQRFGGNPLAVFPDARGMTDAQMRALANEFNLSETTFVLPPDDPTHTARVRIFTPKTELPFAGHPNVGTGWVLAGQRRDRDGVLLFEEAAGLVKVEVAREGGGIVGIVIAAPKPLTLGRTFPVSGIAACAGLGAGDIVTAAHEPLAGSVGTMFVCAETTAQALSRAAPDTAAFRRLEEQTTDLGHRLALYLYCRDGTRLRARMFYPLGGIPEDSATGSAATVLAALLLSLGDATEGAWDIVQGVEMGRPSLLRTTAARTPDGIRATVGGNCVPVLRGTATV